MTTRARSVSVSSSSLHSSQLQINDKVFVCSSHPRPFRFVGNVIDIRPHYDLLAAMHQQQHQRNNNLAGNINNKRSSSINTFFPSSIADSLNSSTTRLDDSNASYPPETLYVFIRILLRINGSSTSSSSTHQHHHHHRPPGYYSEFIAASPHSSRAKYLDYPEVLGFDGWVPMSWCVKYEDFMRLQSEANAFFKRGGGGGGSNLVRQDADDNDDNGDDDQDEGGDKDEDDEDHIVVKDEKDLEQDRKSIAAASSSDDEDDDENENESKKQGQQNDDHDQNGENAALRGRKKPTPKNSKKTVANSSKSQTAASAPKPITSSALVRGASLAQAFRAAEYPVSLIYLGYEIGNLLPSAWASVCPLQAPQVATDNVVHSMHLCHRCLTPFPRKTDLEVHLFCCPSLSLPHTAIEVFVSPSGNSAIYRVDGAAEPEYCTRLAVLGRAFIGSKDLWDTDIRQVEFYVIYGTAERLGVTDVLQEQVILSAYNNNNNNKNSAGALSAASYDPRWKATSSLRKQIRKSSSSSSSFIGSIPASGSLFSANPFSHQNDKSLSSSTPSAAATPKHHHDDSNIDPLFFAGFFSRIKPQANHVLCCIMLLPCFQNRGLGTLLVKLAYSLDQVRLTECGCDECCAGGKRPGNVTEPWSMAGTKVLCAFLREKLGLGAKRLMNDLEERRKEKEKQLLREQHLKHGQQNHHQSDNNNNASSTSSSSSVGVVAGRIVADSNNPFLSGFTNQTSLPVPLSLPPKKSPQPQTQQQQQQTSKDKNNTTNPANSTTTTTTNATTPVVLPSSSYFNLTQIRQFDPNDSMLTKFTAINSAEMKLIDDNQKKNPFADMFSSSSAAAAAGATKQPSHHHKDHKSSTKDGDDKKLPARRDREDENDNNKSKEQPKQNVILVEAPASSTASTTSQRQQQSGAVIKQEVVSTGFTTSPISRYCAVTKSYTFEALAEKLFPVVHPTDALKMLIANNLIAEIPVISKMKVTKLLPGSSHHSASSTTPNPPSNNNTNNSSSQSTQQQQHQHQSSSKEIFETQTQLGIILIPREIAFNRIQEKLREDLKRAARMSPFLWDSGAPDYMLRHKTSSKSSSSSSSSSEPKPNRNPLYDFLTEEHYAMVDPMKRFDGYVIGMFHS